MEVYINDGTVCFSCPFTTDCENTRCFWKQRDCYDLCAWETFDSPEHDQTKRDIMKKYGAHYFPEWKVCTGTNCLTMCCEDIMLPNRPSSP